jgi:hypothetical protein
MDQLDPRFGGNLGAEQRQRSIRRYLYTIRALLKGESLTAFETALEDVRADPDPNVAVLQALTNKHIGLAMDQVSNAVFPKRALEIQKLWMVRGMKKPYDLSTRKTAAAITKINNCLPVFPLGSPASKFTDQEVVGLLEWSLPATWRKKFDLDGYVPTLGTKAKLILECEAIEQNEIVKEKERKDDDNNNNKFKKNKFGNSAARGPKNERGVNGQFYCKNCGLNRTHTTCFFFRTNRPNARKRKI